MKRKLYHDRINHNQKCEYDLNRTTKQLTINKVILPIIIITPCIQYPYICSEWRSVWPHVSLFVSFYYIFSFVSLKKKKSKIFHIVSFSFSNLIFGFGSVCFERHEMCNVYKMIWDQFDYNNTHMNVWFDDCYARITVFAEEKKKKKKYIEIICSMLNKTNSLIFIQNSYLIGKGRCHMEHMKHMKHMKHMA